MLLLVFIALVIPNFSFAYDCKKTTENKLQIDNRQISFYSSHDVHDLKEETNSVTHLIISLHGTLRNGRDYYIDMCEAVKNNLEHTMVIAPTFKRVDDPRQKNEFFWGRRWYEKWKYGYSAQNAQIGSFHIMDKLIEHFDGLKKFPNLKKIFLIGHSAGGQFVQRYAVASEINARTDADVSLIVSNPSSYLYLHPHRIKFENNEFISFKPDLSCPEYNDYIYGIDTGLPTYFNGFSKKELIENFSSNNVIYLMGEEDKETDYLDRSCEANLQGLNRIDRAYNFFQYLRTEMRDHNHKFLSVYGVGHDHVKVFNSKEAKNIFFNTLEDKDLIRNHIGNQIDIKKKTKHSFILMGGGENDSEAFKYFLKEANGGDIIVLSTKSKINHRYTHYLWKLAEENEIKINSVTTISTKNRNETNNKSVISAILNAEGIFLTGGDQFRYKSYWEKTDLLNALQYKIKSGLPLAGTSAGLAVMGEYYFSAENGTIYSEEALKNPSSKKIKIEKQLINHELLNGIITDSHFLNRDREGRLLSFMSFIKKQYNDSPYGIGVDEQTSLILNKSYMIKTGIGNVTIYKENSHKSLNFGPVKKYKIELNSKYPPLRELDLNYDLINVSNGEVTKLDL